MTNLFGKVRASLKKGNRVTKRKWLHFIGLTTIELIMVMLLAWPFLETTSAHPALPDDLESDLQMIDPAGFGLQVDTPPVNYGPEAAIPALQGSNTTTLTVSIETSNEAVVDSNGNTLSGNLPEVYVIAAAVTNQGSEAAANVVITLDYNDSAPWVLVTGEDSTRTVDNLEAGETTYVYWFAQQDPNDANIGDIHQYTVTAVADNAAQVSTSQNKFEPNLNYTVKTVSYQSTGNQGLSLTDFGVNVGVAFTMTQVFSTGTNPVNLLLNPVGNSDFDAAAYRLLKVEGRALDDADTELATFTDAVSVTVPISTTKVEVNYNFVALLPRKTSVCSYIGVIADNDSRKFDEDFCDDNKGTRIDIDGSIALEMTKQVNLVDTEQGQTLQYTINYTNTDPTQTIQYGWFWDDVPAGVSILTNTISPASDPNETTDTRVAWKKEAIGPNSSGTLSFSALVDGGGADIADGTTLLNGANFGINPGNSVPAHTALTSTVESTVHAPVIEVSKTDGVTTANPGDSLTYVIQITNTGSAAATGLVVTDVLPANVLPGTPSITPSSQNGQTLVWNNLGTLAANDEPLQISIPVQVDPNLSQDGTVLTNNVEVSYQNSAGHTFSTETADDTTTVDVPTSQLSLSKTAQDKNGEPLIVGDNITYTLQVTNTGAFTAYNVTVTDDLPDEVTCQSVIGGPGACADPLIWNVGNMAPNQTNILSIDVQINQDADGQDIINSATVTSTNATDPDPDPKVCPDGSTPVDVDPNDCGDSTPGPDTTLDLTKTAEHSGGDDDILEVGDNITYTLQVTNTGTFTAYNVVVTDDLPDEVTCQSVIGGPGACADPLIWNVGNLGSNESDTLLIIVEIDPSGEGQQIINSATVTGTNVFDPPPMPKVCPGGEVLVGGGTCPTNNTPAPDPDGSNGVFLPIIMKN